MTVFYSLYTCGDSVGDSIGKGEAYAANVAYDLSRKAHAGKLFFSWVQGDARKYSFDPPGDTFSIKPAASTDVLTRLVESQFSPYEWITRESATHAKSKTYSASRFA